MEWNNHEHSPGPFTTYQHPGLLSVGICYRLCVCIQTDDVNMLKPRITEAVECMIPDIIIRIYQGVKCRFQILRLTIKITIGAHVEVLMHKL